MLELRARNLLGAPAVDNGDTEAAWRIYLPSVRKFYAGDFPVWRLYTTLSGLEEVEQATPRIQHTLLLQREVVGVLELSPAVQLIPTERLKLAAAALRAGSIPESQRQMKMAQSELTANGGGASVTRFLAESELSMTSLYLARHDLTAAAQMLEAADRNLAETHNAISFKNFAVARAELRLAQGHPEGAESMLEESLRKEEWLARSGGADNIPAAQLNRSIYAALAAVWLAEGRSGEDVLALWERYRLGILGIPVAACPDKGLTCLRPKLSIALKQLGPDQVFGQIVLLDRVLFYRANAQGVVWTSVALDKDDVMAAAAATEQAASSPATTQDSVDRAARRAGDLLLSALPAPSSATGQLLIESDPLLGNLPWPAVETAAGPLGLRYDLAEVPSLLLVPRSSQTPLGQRDLPASGNPLVVGASLASGQSGALPEVLDEAKAVARFGQRPNVLLGDQATGVKVSLRLGSAPAIHFAGHAIKEAGAAKLLLASSGTAAPGTNAGLTAPDLPYLDSTVLRKHPPRSARLVVFSACSTGQKEQEWNHGMGDIVDTLAALGVPEVVATRWQIDSAAAVPMMDSFYGSLAQGSSVSHALTAARQTLIRDARYRHPYYWAAYYASGSVKSDLSQIFHVAK